MSGAATNDAQASLDDLIDTWGGWGLALTDRPQLIEPIESGRTNYNYRLSAPGLSGDLLMRINHPNPSRLGIDRKREREILALASDAGLSRPVWHWDCAQRFVIFPYLRARTWTTNDLDNAKQCARLWPMIERLHEMAPNWPRRRYHAYLRHYWQQLEKTGEADPALKQAWRKFEPRLKAFDEAPWSACLVHHDLIPDNILDTGERLYLIDWEYAAPGHPGIDVWTVDPTAVREPFIAEMMGWINGLWERLILISEPDQAAPRSCR